MYLHLKKFGLNRVVLLKDVLSIEAGVDDKVETKTQYCVYITYLDHSINVIRSKELEVELAKCEELVDDLSTALKAQRLNGEVSTKPLKSDKKKDRYNDR